MEAFVAFTVWHLTWLAEHVRVMELICVHAIRSSSQVQVTSQITMNTTNQLSDSKSAVLNASTSLDRYQTAFVALLLTLMTGCESLFPREAGSELPQFHAKAPRQGDVAPDVTLYTLEGDPITLHAVTGEMPVVVQLGSVTCPVFRYRRFDMRPLRERYAGRVRFLLLYTTEAHPVGSASPYRDDEWIPWINKLARVADRQPETLDERLARASDVRRRLRSNAEFLVDDMQNRGWEAYGAAPSAAFVIDTQRRVALRQAWIEPKELTRTLDTLLSESSASYPGDG
ncbi:MAG: deiodinase-like protein [Pseudomonadota bacterium]